MTWRKFSGEIIQLPIIEEVERAIERESLLGNKLKVCIGTDSQVKGTVTDFATVIVFFTRSPRRIYVHPSGAYLPKNEH